MTTLNVDQIRQNANFIYRLLIYAKGLRDPSAKSEYIHGCYYHILKLPPEEGLGVLIVLREIAGENLSMAIYSAIWGMPSWPDDDCEVLVSTYRKYPGAGLIDNIDTLRERARAIGEALARYAAGDIDYSCLADDEN